MQLRKITILFIMLALGLMHLACKIEPESRDSSEIKIKTALKMDYKSICVMLDYDQKSLLLVPCHKKWSVEAWARDSSEWQRFCKIYQVTTAGSSCQSIDFLEFWQRRLFEMTDTEVSRSERFRLECLFAKNGIYNDEKITHQHELLPSATLEAAAYDIIQERSFGGKCYFKDRKDQMFEHVEIFDPKDKSASLKTYLYKDIDSSVALPNPIHFDKFSKQCRGWIYAHEKLCSEKGEYVGALPNLLRATNYYSFTEFLGEMEVQIKTLSQKIDQRQTYAIYQKAPTPHQVASMSSS